MFHCLRTALGLLMEIGLFILTCQQYNDGSISTAYGSAKYVTFKPVRYYLDLGNY